MSTPVILVIDDSATIRKMVDSHLSQEGYRVVLAPTGEAGIQLAREVAPDLILLDHQLPGTTGIEVCRKIIAFPECRTIPFLVSSTLRKQAYVEYMDVANVVDSLPKPFKPELLKMAVANALETSAMIMASQSNGTAVPEVVGGIDQPAFSGDLRWLSLREVIDFLNNGQKFGMLEVETERNRICFYLQHGRIQGVVSASFDPELITLELPDALKELAPLIPFTMSSGSSTQASGLVELMDKKMLDPRLLRTLLRHQATVLTRYCFLNQPTAFSFLPERNPPVLMQKVAVDCCLAAILVDGATAAANSPSRLDPGDSGEEPEKAWARHALRGQNLDRTGLNARHVQLLSLLDATPRSTTDLATRAGLSVNETRAVLKGLALADWVESCRLNPSQIVMAYESDPAGAATLRQIIESPKSGWTGNVVRDELSLKLLLKRKAPQKLLIQLQGDCELDLPPGLDRNAILNGPWNVALLSSSDKSIPIAPALKKFCVIPRPYRSEDILCWLNRTPENVAAVHKGLHSEQGLQGEQADERTSAGSTAAISTSAFILETTGAN